MRTIADRIDTPVYASATAMTPHDPARSADALRLAARMAEIEPFHVMEIQRRAFELEAAGRRIVHMEIGQPDFPAPQPVIEAAIAALRRDPMGYAASLGLPAVNVGIRQRGRERARNIIDVTSETGAILEGIARALQPDFRLSLKGLVNPYGDGHAAERIVKILTEVELGERLLIKPAVPLEPVVEPFPVAQES